MSTVLSAQIGAKARVGRYSAITVRQFSGWGHLVDFAAKAAR